MALFCILTLSACGTVSNVTSFRPGANGSKWQTGNLSAYLRQMMGSKVEKLKNSICVTLPSDSLFQPGPSSVTLSNAADIGVLANACKKNPHMDIAVDAYTDCVHSEEKNLTASELEAWLIKKALVERGISAGRITAQGWGESKPVATNATLDGRKANRRVTITFEPGKS